MKGLLELLIKIINPILDNFLEKTVPEQFT